MSDEELDRDELMALMVAELDARLHDRGAVKVVDWPDRRDDVSETVELIARDDGGELVVEHTRTESYVGQIDDHNAIAHYFPRGGPDLPDAGDLGSHLSLVVPTRVFATAVPPKHRPRAGDAITQWVREHVGDVPWPRRPGEPVVVYGSDDRVPFKWGLLQAFPPEFHMIGALADVVRVDFWRPDDLEDRRRDRLDVALGRKLRKLHAAAVGVGQRRSILVLEDRDTSMSSPMAISEALAKLSDEHDLPDAIYLLNTRMGNPLAMVLLDEGQWLHDHQNFGWHPFDDHRSSQLNALQTNWR